MIATNGFLTALRVHQIRRTHRGAYNTLPDRKGKGKAKKWVGKRGEGRKVETPLYQFLPPAYAPGVSCQNIE